MTEDKKIPPSKIYYNTTIEKMDKKEEMIFSVESQTDEGAKDLFTWVKSQFHRKGDKDE